MGDKLHGRKPPCFVTERYKNKPEYKAVLNMISAYTKLVIGDYKSKGEDTVTVSGTEKVYRLSVDTVIGNTYSAKYFIFEGIRCLYPELDLFIISAIYTGLLTLPIITMTEINNQDNASFAIPSATIEALIDASYALKDEIPKDGDIEEYVDLACMAFFDTITMYYKIDNLEGDEIKYVH